MHLGASEDAGSVKDAMQKAITTLPDKLVKTIIWDQGAEVGRHVEFTIETGIPIYVCGPHSPWQRAPTRTQRLLRQYIPKGTDLSTHSAEDLDAHSEEPQQTSAQGSRYLKPSESSPNFLRHPLKPPLRCLETVTIRGT